MLIIFFLKFKMDEIVLKSSEENGKIRQYFLSFSKYKISLAIEIYGFNIERGLKHPVSLVFALLRYTSLLNFKIFIIHQMISYVCIMFRKLQYYSLKQSLTTSCNFYRISKATHGGIRRKSTYCIMMKQGHASAYWQNLNEFEVFPNVIINNQLMI